MFLVWLFTWTKKKNRCCRAFLFQFILHPCLFRWVPHSFLCHCMQTNWINNIMPPFLPVEEAFDNFRKSSINCRAKEFTFEKELDGTFQRPNALKCTKMQFCSGSYISFSQHIRQSSGLFLAEKQSTRTCDWKLYRQGFICINECFPYESTPIPCIVPLCTVLPHGLHRNMDTKFHDFSMTFNMIYKH